MADWFSNALDQFSQGGGAGIIGTSGRLVDTIAGRDTGYGDFTQTLANTLNPMNSRGFFGSGTGDIGSERWGTGTFDHGLGGPGGVLGEFGGAEGALNQAWDWLNTAPEQGVQKVGSPGDVVDLNEQNVQAYRDLLGGQIGQAGQRMGQAAQGFGQAQDFNFGPNMMQRLQSTPGAGQQNALINQLTGSAYDPMAAQNAFLSTAPQFQQVARNTVDRNAAMNRAQQLSQDAQQRIASQFANAGGGAVHSGAGLAAMQQGALQPLLDAETQLTQQETQLAGNLMGRAQNQLGQQFRTAGQLGQQGLGMGLQGLQNLSSQDLQRLQQLQNAQAQQQQLRLQGTQGLGNLGMQGMQTALPQLGSISQQNYWSPEYVTSPTYGQQLLQGLGGAASQAGGQLLGTAVGALI